MPKIYSHTVSLIKDSNRVVACSESDVELARIGSYFRPKNSRIVYQIVKVNSIFPIYDFKLINPKHLRIEEGINRKFLKDDILDVSYKEYELSSIFEIINPGTGYKVDDILKPANGVTSYEVSSGLRFPAEIVVNDVDIDGKIISIGLKSNGKYVSIPTTDTFIGGKGSGARFKCDFELINQRQIIERTIVLIDYQENETNIFVDYSLPEGLIEGKIAVKKIELVLDKPYSGETDNSAEYEILNDMTSNYKFPLLVQRGLNLEIALNQTLLILDSKIKELEDKINKLS